MAGDRRAFGAETGTGRPWTLGQQEDFLQFKEADSAASGVKRGVNNTPAVGWSAGETGLPLPGDVTSAPWWQWGAINDDSLMSVSVTMRLSSWAAPNGTFKHCYSSCAVFSVSQNSSGKSCARFQCEDVQVGMSVRKSWEGCRALKPFLFSQVALWFRVRSKEGSWRHNVLWKEEHNSHWPSP